MGGATATRIHDIRPPRALAPTGRSSLFRLCIILRLAAILQPRITAFNSSSAPSNSATAPPDLALAGRATQVFTDFPKLSRAVTRDFYRSVIGKGNLKRATLMPVAEFAAGLKTM